MNLSQDQFFKGSFNFRQCANGPVETVPRFSYESDKKLYDVIQFAEFNVYQVNGKTQLTKDRIHLAILAHFNLTPGPKEVK